MSISPFVAKTNILGKEISIEAGAMAKQACGSVLVRAGEDIVLATVVSEDKDTSMDFFPLTVEYQEKFYSAGKVPGGFFRREGRPSYEATLTARMIDRPLRPCFPKGYCYDTQIVCTTLSYSGTFPLGILATIGASSAVHNSDIPFNGPVGAIQVGRINGELKANLSVEEMEKSDLHMVVAGTRTGILMVEGACKFLSEDKALEALKFAHKNLQPLLDMQDDLRKQTGNKTDRQWKPFELVCEEDIKSVLTEEKIREGFLISDKTKRALAFKEMKTQALEKVLEGGESDPLYAKKDRSVREVMEERKYQVARSQILTTKKRIDGRSENTVRPITSHVGLLPRVHGSALFTRGETQILASTTLGTADDEQKVDALAGFSKKQFLLHYNFPPYCVGETGRLGGQSRREIGHGYLAEKALVPILPSHQDFPYTIRVVSEVLESNGSSSMGTVCAGSLSLMQAGVPVSEPVAGIAMGLITEGDKASVLSDILGDEDHLGDMDFKVAGGKNGITALQMDIKSMNLSFELMEKALHQAKEGRLHILNEMNKTLSEVKKDLSPYAPRIRVIQIKQEKIRDVIGSGGKVINKIIEDTGVKVDILDSGQVFISSTSAEGIQKAEDLIQGICEEVEVGAVYNGKVMQIAPFGAFVEILPKTTGLLHISEIARERIAQVSDVLKEGDEVKVKVLEVGDRGRIRLSRKALL